MMIVVLPEAGDVIRACGGEGWEKRRIKGRLVSLEAGGKKGAAWVCSENIGEKAKGGGQHR